MRVPVQPQAADGRPGSQRGAWTAPAVHAHHARKPRPCWPDLAWVFGAVPLPPRRSGRGARQRRWPWTCAARMVLKPLASNREGARRRVLRDAECCALCGRRRLRGHRQGSAKGHPASAGVLPADDRPAHGAGDARGVATTREQQWSGIRAQARRRRRRDRALATGALARALLGCGGAVAEPVGRPLRSGDRVNGDHASSAGRASSAGSCERGLAAPSLQGFDSAAHAETRSARRQPSRRCARDAKQPGHLGKPRARCGGSPRRLFPAQRACDALRVMRHTQTTAHPNEMRLSANRHEWFGNPEPWADQYR